MVLDTVTITGVPRPEELSVDYHDQTGERAVGESMLGLDVRD